MYHVILRRAFRTKKVWNLVSENMKYLEELILKIENRIERKWAGYGIDCNGGLLDFLEII